MHVSVSLKQLRTNPREYVRLLNAGYEVAITEHRKVMARAQNATPAPQKGNGAGVLKAIKSLPKIDTPYPDMDTVELIKKTREEGFKAKQQRR